jgi:hypothetical protein
MIAAAAATTAKEGDPPPRWNCPSAARGRLSFIDVVAYPLSRNDLIFQDLHGGDWQAHEPAEAGASRSTSMLAAGSHSPVHHALSRGRSRRRKELVRQCLSQTSPTSPERHLTWDLTSFPPMATARSTC